MNWFPRSRRTLRPTLRSGLIVGWLPAVVVAFVGLALGFGATHQRPLTHPESVVEVPEPSLSMPAPLPADTIYGPQVFDIPSGDSALHVEEVEIVIVPGAMFYEVEIENGAGGVDEVDYARVEINGIELVSNEELLSSTTVKTFGLAEDNDLIVELWGEEGSYVTVSVRTSFLPYTVLAHSQLTREDPGPPIEDSLAFELPDDVIPPFGVIFSTGQWADSAWIDLNGVEVVGPDDFVGATDDGLVEVTVEDTVNTLEVRFAAPTPGGLDVQVVGVIHDTIPPELEVTSPQDGFVTGDDSVMVQGIVRDAWPNLYVYFSAPPPQWEIEDSTFSALVALPNEGPNVLYPTAYDVGANTTDTTLTIIRDTSAPALTVTAPEDGIVIGQDSVTVSGSVTDATAVTVEANGVPLPVDGAGLFTGGISLAEGANFVTVAATDEGDNSSQVVRVVTVDTEPPQISVTSPTDQSTTSADSVDVTGTVTDATDITLTLNSVSVPIDSLGAFDTRIGLASGVNTLAFLATDEAGNQAADTVEVTQDDGDLPPDPATVASDIETNVASTIGDATAFLYEGADPIQTGVDPGTIDPVRVTVLKGRVLDRSGQPLSGVAVSVLDHPEFGQTLTRSDGQYDLAVNGGGLLNVRFQRSGYPDVQRRSELPWQDYRVLDDVVMTPLDTAVTSIDFSDPIEIAQGTPQTDSDGTRQATLMFRQGTTATMTLPNGTVDTLSSLSVRATEYTVGDDGPEAMPAALPPTTAYTYAVELSADEAIAAGAERVEFDQPVSFYLDNFLDMPVGLGIPVGYFDRTQGEWIGEQDGRVIEVTAIDSLGIASLNIDTIAGAEHPDTLLAHLAIDADELAAIGSQYSVGDELWRGEVTHFSPYDYNFGARLRDNFIAVWEFLQDPYVPDWLVPDDCTGCEGSIINVEGQYVDERAPVVGTPYSLSYSSLRVPGRASSFRLEIPVLGDSIPSQLTRATLEIMVAGRRWQHEFSADSAVTHAFVWDGRDAYDRLLFGQQSIRTVLTYYFGPQIMLASVGGGGGGSSFGQPGGGGVSATISSREEPGVSIEWEGIIGTHSLDRSLAGWSLDVHHSYDPIASRLYLGDGTNRSATSGVNVVGTITGTGVNGGGAGEGDGGLATDAPVGQPWDVVVSAEGEVAVLSFARIRVIDDDGTINTVAGGGSLTPDSVPADSADLSGSVAMAYGPDGSLWLASPTAQRIFRIWPDGIVESFGNAGGYAGDGGSIRSDSVRLTHPDDITVAPDGSVYFIQGHRPAVDCLSGGCRRVRRIGPEGTITTVAGGGTAVGDTVPAIEAGFGRPSAIAAGPDGSIYIGDRGVIRRIRPDGIIERFAGTDHLVGFGDDYDGDLGPALDARIWVSADGLAVGRDGSVYFSQVGGAIRVVDAQGVIRTIAGTGVEGYSGDGGRALSAQFRRPRGLALSPDGDLIMADRDDHRVRRLGPALPGFTAGGHLIASEDGSVVYQFTPAGQHIQTLSALTGATLYAFSYDSENRLIGITDGNGLATTIARDGSGDPTSITGPFGHQTTLSLDANGFLASVTNPASEVHAFVTDSLGLLEEFITPTSDTTRMTYDAEGRLTQHVDAAGRLSTLTRSEGDEFLQVDFERGTRTSSYRVETDSTGAVIRTVTDPAGNASETVEALDGVTTATGPRGRAPRVRTRGSGSRRRS